MRAAHVVAPTPPKALKSFARVVGFEDLDRVREPALNAVLLERRLAPSVTASFADWARGPAFVRKTTVHVDRLDPWEMAMSAPEPRGWPMTERTGHVERARRRLAADIAQVSRWVAEVTSNPLLQISIVVTDDDECSKFHADFIRLRAVITYAGPGTEYVPNDATNRAKLCCNEEPEEANALICTDPSRIVRAAVGDVMCLKGMLWSKAGAVHRSPPLTGRGIRRMMLKVNDVSPD